MAALECPTCPLPRPTSLSGSTHSFTRRSISIFSRRGPDDFVVMPQHISAIMARRSSSRPGERRKARDQRKDSALGQCTALNAVPQSNIAAPMTPVMHARTPSLNEDIVSAITERQTGLDHSGTTWYTHSPVSAIKEKRNDTASRIGVWRNGVAHWDIGLEKQAPRKLAGGSLEAFMDWPLPPNSTGSKSQRSSRPSLSVIIPEGRTRSNVEPLPSQSKVTIKVGPAAIVSKFSSAAQALKHRKPEERLPTPAMSALVSPLDEEQVAFLDLDESPVEPPLTAPALLEPSRSSSSSDTIPSDPDYEDDDASCYSQKSSRTSVETSRGDDHIILNPGWNFSDKPKRSISAAFSLMSPHRAGVFDEPYALQNTSNVDLNKPLPPSPPPQPKWQSFVHPQAAHVKAQSIQSLRVMTSTLKKNDLSAAKSCRSLQKLHMFDVEFMKTDPYSSDCTAPTTPTLSEAEDDLKARLGTIQDIPPLRIRQQRTREETTDEPPVPQISDSLSRVPTLPPKSRKREWKRRASSEQHGLGISVESPQLPPLRRRSASDLRDTESDKEVVVRPSDHVRRSSSNSAIPKIIDFYTTSGDTVEEEPQPVVMPKIVIDDGLIPCEDNRRSYKAKSARLSILIPTFAFDDGLIVVEGPDTNNDQTCRPKSQQTPQAAEVVLLRIMALLPSLSDLTSTSGINKGMRRVYKQNELSLFRSVLKTGSPAAWELREWSPPHDPDCSPDLERSIEYTAITYKRDMLRDAQVLEDLKHLILERCQTFLRAETVEALSSRKDVNTHRFDEAFYRIWSFCKIFGCDKGREDDISGQLDWLKGGVLAHQQGCAATVSESLEFDMSSILLNAPDHFARCNAGCLSADELYDMTELWNCLAALLQGYMGRVEQARAAGIYNNSGVKIGDVEKERTVLEEWIFYALSLGPSVVLTLAEHAMDRSETGFTIASSHGWTEWTATAITGGRSTFFKEPVSRLYEERMLISAISSLSPKDQARREHSRKRVANLAAEIRAARCASNYKRLPLIDMSQERPWSTVTRQSSSGSTTTLTSVQRVQSPGAPPSVMSAMSPKLFSGAWSPRKVSPIIEDRVESFNRFSITSLPSTDLPLPEANDGMNTVEKAIKRIVAMGFTISQAKRALIVTDQGDGLRVDSAVEFVVGRAQHWR